MMIYVYTLTFAINKNGEGSTASTSHAFASREKAEEWLIDTPARADEALGKAGEGLGGTGFHWHSDCFNSGDSFFHRGFPFW